MTKKPDPAVNGKRRLQTLFVIQNVLVCMLSIYLLKGICFEKPFERHQQELCLLLFVADWPLLAGSWNRFLQLFAAHLPSWAALVLLLAALGLLLAALGRSWAALGRSRAALGRSWAPPGRSCAALGRSWAALGSTRTNP